MFTKARVAWGLLLAGAVLLVLTSGRYLTFDAETYFPRQRAVYERETAGLMVHIIAMLFAALIGPFQFVSGIRTRRPRLHRWMGRTYLAGAGIGAVGGLYIAQFAASGADARIGFALLGVAVLVATGMAFAAIRQRRVQAHREWMTRSYALIFAAVTLRLYLPGLEAAFGEETGYAIVAWLCWIPNLAVAEYIIRTRLRPRATLHGGVALT